MASPNRGTIRYEIGDLEAALETEAQRRLEAETRVRRMREEFDEFILTAAHDLREPLRAVSAYTELLARKNVESVDPEADQYRRYILDGTGRMQALIAGMVDCVTASSDSRYLLSIDTNEVFREAEAVFASHPGNPSKIVVTREPLPVLRGDFEKMVKVARHLFDNAGRYSDKPETHVHVSSRRDGPVWLFTVKDDGPGIEAPYHQRIFEPFKRLHGRNYVGCGLGLTFCQKAVESHGGRMWVESQPNAGTAFCFTLPATD